MMKKNTTQIFASILLGVTIISIALVIYFSSAKFVDVPEIILPSENLTEQQRIEFTNNKIIEAIVIDEHNYKNIIEKLNRPTNYTMSVFNEIYAFDAFRSEVTEVSVNNSTTVATRDSTEYTVTENEILVKKNNQTIEFDKLDFTSDQIIGIPSYEDLINLHTEVTVSDDFFNEEQAITITFSLEETTEIYTVSLVTGILMKYDILQDGNTVRSVSIKNLEIY
ncbi:MAG: hypothetical protein R3Y12_08415 [Clostridia bacterium]